MHSMPGSRSIWSGLPGSSGSTEIRRDLDLGVGAVELRAGLEEPDDVERGRRQRPSPGRPVLLRRRLLAGLGAEQLVVAEVLREPELQHEHAVLAQPGADVRAVHRRRRRRRSAACPRDRCRRAGGSWAWRCCPPRGSPRAWRRASKPCPSWRPCTPTARPPSSTTRSTSVCSATVRLGRSMTGCRNALAALTRRPSRIVAIA